MTADELNRTPLYSRVQFSSMTGVIVNIKNSVATLYDAANFTTIYNAYPMLMTLIETYKPPVIPKPPYTLDTIPLYSKVSTRMGEGIVINKSAQYNQLYVFYAGIDNGEWVDFGYITFIAPPPGATYVPAAPPVTPVQPVVPPYVPPAPAPAPVPAPYVPPAPYEPEEELPAEVIPSDAGKASWIIYGLIALGIIAVLPE